MNVIDRAISKWENGICMPDSGIITELCKILNITINDLFSGEVVDMKNNEKRLEENLLKITKLKEEKDKELLKIEFVIGVIVTITFLTLVFIASFVDMQNWVRILLFIIGFILFIIGIAYCLRILQTAGYYECDKCHHKYIPTFISVLLAVHVNRTRYLKCPKCGKRSWSKKVISK